MAPQVWFGPSTDSSVVSLLFWEFLWAELPLKWCNLRTRTEQVDKLHFLEKCLTKFGQVLAIVIFVHDALPDALQVWLVRSKMDFANIPTGLDVTRP